MDEDIRKLIKEKKQEKENIDRHIANLRKSLNIWLIKMNVYYVFYESVF